MTYDEKVPEHPAVAEDIVALLQATDVRQDKGSMPDATQFLGRPAARKLAGAVNPFAGCEGCKVRGSRHRHAVREETARPGTQTQAPTRWLRPK